MERRQRALNSSGIICYPIADCTKITYIHLHNPAARSSRSSSFHRPVAYRSTLSNTACSHLHAEPATAVSPMTAPLRSTHHGNVTAERYVCVRVPSSPVYQSCHAVDRPSTRGGRPARPRTARRGVPSASPRIAQEIARRSARSEAISSSHARAGGRSRPRRRTALCTCCHHDRVDLVGALRVSAGAPSALARVCAGLLPTASAATRSDEAEDSLKLHGAAAAAGVRTTGAHGCPCCGQRPSVATTVS